MMERIRLVREAKFKAKARPWAVLSGGVHERYCKSPRRRGLWYVVIATTPRPDGRIVMQISSLGRKPRARIKQLPRIDYGRIILYRGFLQLPVSRQRLSAQREKGVVAADPEIARFRSLHEPGRFPMRWCSTTVPASTTIQPGSMTDAEPS
jgi:hypothetical protein